MITDSKILKAIFFIQLVSSFLVVVGHFTADVLDFTSPFWVLELNQLSRYGTVLLTIVSGYLTAFSFEKKNPTWRQFFTGKVIYIYIPFLLSGVLYHYLLHNGMPHTRADFINILLGKTGAHLYFIFMICQYYIFAYLFRNLITKKNIPYLIWLFMIVQYVYINNIHQGWLGLTTRHMLPTWIFTFYLGHMIFWYREAILTYLRKKQAVLILFTGLATLSAAYFVISSKLFVAVHLTFVFACLVTFLVMMVFLLELVDVIKIRFHKGFTYYVYLFHSACLILLNDLLKGHYGDVSWLFLNKWYSLLYLGVVYFCTGLVAILVARLFQNIEALVKNRSKLQREAA